MEDDCKARAELRACYDDLLHLIDQIPSVSDEEKRRKYFETVPLLVQRKFGSSGFNVFHFAAANRSPDILKVFDLEKKLFPGDVKSRISLLPDNNGNHPFIYALIDYERGPNFRLAEKLVYSSSLGGIFEPQLFLRGSVEDLLRDKNILLGNEEVDASTWSVWSVGLDMFRSAHLLLLPQFSDSVDSSVERASVPSLERRLSEESLSTLHQLPLPYLILVLLGLRLKSSLRTQSIRRAFDGQEVAVDQSLEFLQTYLQLSPKLSLASLKNHRDESIFEFTQRMYFMQVGDPLQLMRHFAFFLSWANPPRKVSSKLLPFVATNPLLNPIERLNYVIMLAASTAHHPLHHGENAENAENIYSIRDAISTIESDAARLSSAEVDEAVEQDHRHQEEVEPSPVAGNSQVVESRAERGAEATGNQRESEGLSTSNDRDDVGISKKEDEFEPTEFSFLPAMTLLAIGNTLCEGPPSLKFLARRCVRSHLDFSKILFPTENNSSANLPQFILDYLRMREYRNVKIRFEEQTIPNSGIPRTEVGPEFLISFEKVLHLQIPVIHHC